MLTMATLTMATLTMAHLVELEQPRVAAARVDLLSNLYKAVAAAGAYFGALQGGRLSTPPPGPILLPPCPLTSIVNLVYYLLATLD